MSHALLQHLPPLTRPSTLRRQFSADDVASSPRPRGPCEAGRPTTGTASEKQLVRQSLQLTDESWAELWEHTSAVVGDIRRTKGKRMKSQLLDPVESQAAS